MVAASIVTICLVGGCRSDQVAAQATARPAVRICDIITPPPPIHNPHAHVPVPVHPSVTTQTKTLSAYAYNDQTGLGSVQYNVDTEPFMAPDGWAITNISGVLVTTANPMEASAGKWLCSVDKIPLAAPMTGTRGVTLTAKAGSKDSFGANVWIGVQVDLTLTAVPGLHYPGPTTAPTATAKAVGMQIVFQGAAPTGGWMQLVNAANGNVYAGNVPPNADPATCAATLGGICNLLGLKYTNVNDGLRIDGKGNEYFGYGVWSTSTDY